jgi:uncharacterized protein YndB with AHSA1/START domain
MKYALDWQSLAMTPREDGFQQGWGQCADQLAALAEKM